MGKGHDVDTAERQALLEGKLVHLRLELAIVLQELPEGSGLTQAELAERLNVEQSAIAKLERAGDHKLESILRYLGEFDADLLMAVKQGDTTVQVSDDEKHLLVAMPRVVDEWAADQHKNLDEFVLEAVQNAHAHPRYDADPGRASVSPRHEAYER